MGVNLKKEGAEIRHLLDQADELDFEADQKIAEADDLRWLAAERVHSLIAIQKATTQKAFAAVTGMTTAHISRLVRVWQWWMENGSGDDYGPVRPTFYNAEELTRDASLHKRALSQGRAPSTVAKNERDARLALRNPESAEVIMSDPAVRETTRRAIVAAEATEAKAKLMASAKPVDVPLPTTGFNWLEAEATLTHARKLVLVVSRMVKEHGPIGDRDSEMILYWVNELRITAELLEAAVKTGDMDEALAQLLEEA
jgi:hypothetical protein